MCTVTSVSDAEMCHSWTDAQEIVSQRVFVSLSTAALIAVHGVIVTVSTLNYILMTRRFMAATHIDSFLSHRSIIRYRYFVEVYDVAVFILFSDNVIVSMSSVDTQLDTAGSFVLRTSDFLHLKKVSQS